MLDRQRRSSARSPLLLSILGVLLAAPPVGCGGGGDGDQPRGATVTGEVTSAGGAPLQGVAVSRVGATGSGVTDASGLVVLDLPAGGEVVLRLSRPGFLDRLELLSLPAGSQSGTFSAVLLPREAPIGIDGIQAGGSATGKHGARVIFPAGALVDAAGQPVSGAVSVTLTPVDVSSGEVLAFPGAFLGIPQGGSRAPIVSFGAADFEVTQGGAVLRLAPGAGATIEIPLYATRNQDGTPLSAGQRIPLWSLDPQTGVWRQEGEAEVVASDGSPTGLAGRATVAHFTPWNLDALAAFPGAFQATLLKCVLGAGNGLPQRDLPAGTSCTVRYTVGDGDSPAQVTTEVIPPQGTSGPLPAGVPLRFDGTARVGGARVVGVLQVTLEPGASGTLLIVLDPLNAPPVANAGPDQTVPVGSTVQLTGAGSRDPDGDPLTFAWSITDRPAGSTAELSDAAAAGPTLVADVVGAWVVRLVVGDGKVESAPDTVRIMAVPPPSLSIDDAQVTEGDAGTTGLAFQVRLSRAVAAAVTVDYATADGTATSPDDYQAGAGTLTIPAGATSGVVTVAVVGDTAPEADETMTVTLGNPSGATIADGQATGTIVDDDLLLPAVTIVATDPTADESGEDLGAFTVTREGPVAAALVVNFTLSGSATPGLDYLDLGTSLTIPAGQASVALGVLPFGDSLVEGAETVVVTLGGGAAYRVGTPASATVVIGDGPVALVSVVAIDAQAAEAGLDPGAFSISRSGNLAGPLEVSFTVGGTATAGEDYLALPSSAVIPAGQPSVELAVTPLADQVVEEGETVVLTLLDGAAYDLGVPASATVTISDVLLASVAVVASDAQAAEKATATGAFTVSRTGPVVDALQVSLAVGGTATAGADYQPLPGAVTIPAGQASVALLVTPVDDAEVEGTETVTLTVTAGAGYTVGVPSTATVSIADNDPPVVTVVATDPSASEAGDPGSFTITRTGATTFGLLLPFASTGTAQSGVDYLSLGSPVVIPVGQSSVTLTVTPIADQLVEGSETVTLQLIFDLTGTWEVGSPSQATVTIEDAPPP